MKNVRHTYENIEVKNGTASMELDDTYRPVVEQLRWDLGLLDNEEEASYSISKLREGVDWRDAKRDVDYGIEYMQSAGTASRLSIEIRRMEADGQYHQYAVGRAEAANEEVTEVLYFTDIEVPVTPSEIFDADTATPIYYHYYQTDTVPDTLHLREILND